MPNPSDRLFREAKAYLSFVAGADSDRAVDARSYHVTRRYDADDFAELSTVLERTGSTAGIAFLGRDATDRANTIERLHDDGHEIVLHGHRHVKFGSLSYETAYDDLATGISSIEDATGIAPSGFFAPFKEVSEGTLRAAAELDVDWVLGTAETDNVPESLTMVDSVYPHDTRLLEGGTSPENAFEELYERADSDSAFLFHPNMLEYYDAIQEFERWLGAVDAVSIDERRRNGGVGIVLDCLRPLKLV